MAGVEGRLEVEHAADVFLVAEAFVDFVDRRGDLRVGGAHRLVFLVRFVCVPQKCLVFLK